MKAFLKSGALALALAASGAAQAATFTFESAAATGTSAGALTTYSETDSGLTMTLTRETGATFDIAALLGAPPSFGDRTLSPFSSINATQFIADFSSAVNNFGFDFGDYAPSDEDDAVANFYAGANGTGALIGTATANWGANGFPNLATLSFSSTTAFLSVKFIGGSAGFPNSVFYDNFTASANTGAVPEPATWGMMLVGFGLVGSALRSRRRITALA